MLISTNPEARFITWSSHMVPRNCDIVCGLSGINPEVNVPAGTRAERAGGVVAQGREGGGGHIRRCKSHLCAPSIILLVPLHFL